MPRGKAPKVYEPDLIEAVGRLYHEEGRTQAEVAEALGLTQKVVWNIMRRHGIATRTAAKRDQAGSNNHSWKGDAATYSAFHHRVEVQRGKPSVCSACDTRDADRYEWANLTGHFEDPNDYVRLCVKCHRRFDMRRRQKGGGATC